MRKFVKTTVVAIAIVASVAGLAKADTEAVPSRVVKVKAQNEKSVKLTYLVDGQADVKVNIYDRQGKLVFSENIVNEKSFSRGYNFGLLPDGLYTLEVVDASGIVEKKIKKEVIYISRIDELAE